MSVQVKRDKAVLLAVLILVATGIYLNSLFCEFVSDDISQVLKNEWIRDFGNIPIVFLKSAWSFLDVEVYSNFYRPFMHLAYMVGYKLSGSEPWGYHAINICIHTLNTVMVFFLACSIVDAASADSREDVRSRNLFVGFFAALLFAVNPINTEVVTWVASVTELGAAFFLFLSFYLYISKRRYSSAFFFLLSLLSKETGMVLPFFLISFDLVIKREPILAVKQWFLRYWPYGVAVLVYAAMRYNAMGVVAPYQTDAQVLSGWQHILNIMPLTAEFLKNLIVPINLTFFHYIRLDNIYSFWELRSIVYTLIFFAVIYIFIRYNRRERAIGFSVIWIVVPLLPIYYLGWVQGEPTYADRFLYLPSAGFSLTVALISMRVVSLASPSGGEWGSGSGRRVLFIISALLLCVALLYSIGTVRRNVVWASALTLWEDTTKKAPWIISARGSYANQLLKHGRLDESYNEYRSIVKEGSEKSDLAEAHNGLGIIYAKKGSVDAAILEFRLALDVKPDMEIARINLEKARKLKEIMRKRPPG